MIIKRPLALKKAWTLTGEASHWSNLRNLVKATLEWADEYFAVSVSESDLIPSLKAGVSTEISRS